MSLPVHPQELEQEQRRAVEAARAACLRGALDAYERAGLGGLCEAGRWEMVVDALQSLDVDAVVRGLAEGPHVETRRDGAGHP
jgi:hypothetical protein